jgi:D-psicose/D-tagatose/L-ribulose 3-epimerase
MAVSNLAWDAGEDADVAELMLSLGITGLEIAPTRIWESPLSSSQTHRAEYKARWADHGITIVSLQALLFGRPDLTLFESAAARTSTFDYLRGMIELAADVGASRLVFGSPRNRARGAMAKDEADEIAITFFRAVGDFAVQAGCVFCLEPNPPQYDCDWITTVEEGSRFVRDVGHAGIGLNADSGGITLAGEEPAAIIPKTASEIAHFHISEPQLSPIGDGGVTHPSFARALSASGYDGWTSVEMRPPAADGRLAVLAKSFGLAVEYYGQTSGGRAG